ncbi:AI-2E family transporter [Verrucomicrobiales bacterium]|nr:AI-2E family transporter [Verrucomicrobiales bacterium]MDB3941409.1 AI-2E family transporter [Verrucomicrobiales bacterium]MDC0263191.1 AI-2E family transporter [Verrucomicrobiales bacterium]MDC3352952.1 AI-2E family transporter [Verrucomicrobiales bacterium]
MTAACLVVVITGLKLAAELFIPIFLGLFLALLSMPILNWLDRHGFPRPLAVLSTVVIDLLILGVIVLLGSSVMGDFQDKSKEYTKRLQMQAADFSRTMDEKIARLENFWAESTDLEDRKEQKSEPESEKLENQTPVDSNLEPEKPNEFEGEDVDAKEGMALFGIEEITFSKLFELYFDENRLLEIVGQFDVVNRFTSLATKSFFALIVMIFVLAESNSYATKVRDVLHVSGPDLRRFQSISQDIQKYLGIKTAASAATGLLAMLTCIVFRVDFPLLWGLVAFLFNYVPAIGSIMAGVPPVILALILHGFWPAAGVMACYLAINVTIGNFIEPMLLGERFGLSTTIVVLSVLVWGYIWGPVGMLLAVPLTMMVKVMLDNSFDFRWISALMGKRQGDSGDEDEPVEDEPLADPEPETA